MQTQGFLVFFDGDRLLNFKTIMLANFIIVGEMTYVDLKLNPERYTGYTGPSARRIWEAIYQENCPKCEFFCPLL